MREKMPFTEKEGRIIELLYIVLFTYIIFIAINRKETIINNRYNNTVLLLFLFVLITVSIYHVEISAAPDLKNYLSSFLNLKSVPITDLSLTVGEDPLFYFLQWIVANSTGSFSLFIVIVWIIIFINISVALQKIFPTSYVLFVFFSYINYFIFFSYILNTMRQGLAISFIILAIAIMITNKRALTFFIFTLIAPLFHISALPISLMLLIIRFFHLKFWAVLSIWILSILLYITNINYILFSSLQIELLQLYTSDNVLARYDGTNRFDFLLFSVIFGIICILIWKYFYNKEEGMYLELLKCYLIFNTYFLFLGFISFSDRLAAFSWMLLPILVWMVVPHTKKYHINAFILLIVFLTFSIMTGSMNIILEAI